MALSLRKVGLSDLTGCPSNRLTFTNRWMDAQEKHVRRDSHHRCTCPGYVRYLRVQAQVGKEAG